MIEDILNVFVGFFAIIFSIMIFISTFFYSLPSDTRIFFAIVGFLIIAAGCYLLEETSKTLR